jgi:hypothetical protein
MKQLRASGLEIKAAAIWVLVSSDNRIGFDGKREVRLSLAPKC